MTGRRSSVVCRTVRMTFVASLRIRSVAESNVAGRSAETRLRRTIGNDRASSSACVGALPCGHPRPVHIRFEITVTMTGSDVPGVWLCCCWFAVAARSGFDRVARSGIGDLCTVIHLKGKATTWFKRERKA